MSPLAIPVGLLTATAYLDARFHIGHDVHLGWAAGRGWMTKTWRERRDRLNLFYTLESYARSRSTAGKDFLAYEGKTWTYREAFDIVLRYGCWLKEKYGVKPKEIVAMDLMNSPQFIFLWIGLWSIGACPAFINYNLRGEPLKHCIKISTARLLFVDEALRENLSPSIEEWVADWDGSKAWKPVKTIFLTPQVDLEISSAQGRRPPDDLRNGVASHDMAALIYTSGTTGMPKAAIVSWGKVSMGSTFVTTWYGLKPGDNFYTCMPLYHTSAALLGFCGTLVTGATFSIGHRFSTRTFWHDVRMHDASIIQYVGETCRYLLAAPPQIDSATGENLDKKHRVRLALGNGLRPDVWNAFKDRFGIATIAEFYAATEGGLALWNLSSNDHSCGAVGRGGTLARLTSGRDFLIVRLDYETEQPLRSGKDLLCTAADGDEPGELLFKLDPKDVMKSFQGYHGNREATTKKVVRDVLVKGDAYFRTGDVMRVDSEGRFWFCDRIGDTFRWKGENVSTAEVQAAIGTHPAVVEANVYGVELPNHDGRAGCAALLLAGEPDSKLLQSLASHVDKNLPRFAVPTFIRIAKAFETTGNYKQQKHGLRTQGVDPTNIANDDRIFWLQDGTYTEFKDRDWKSLEGARVKL